MTFSGFRNGEDAAPVYKTTDWGDSWEYISGNLPNAPVNDVGVDTRPRRPAAGGCGDVPDGADDRRVRARVRAGGAVAAAAELADGRGDRRPADRRLRVDHRL